MNLFNIDFSEIVLRIKIISFILSVIFGFLIVFFIVRFQKLVGFKIEKAKSLLKGQASASGGASRSRWEEIQDHIGSEREAEWKFAVIEADKLLNDLLAQAGFPGETMGERLTNIEKGQLLSLEGLWEAHKVRNKIAHDSNYFLRYSEARRVVKLYEDALRELQAL
jgi:hypothetical protein